VPARAANWVPKPLVGYQVRLARRIDKGSGNRQIWAVEAYDARACEAHAQAADRIPEIRAAGEKLTSALDTEALRVLREYAQTVDIGDASVKEDTSSTHYRRLLEEIPSPTLGEFEGETSTKDKTAYSRRGGYYGPTRSSETGVATATWAVLSGHSGLFTFYEERLWYYESDDGGTRSSRYQTRDSDHDAYEHLDGDQPIEAYEKLRAELARRIRDAAWVNECRVTDTRSRATRIVETLGPLPALPAGVSLDESWAEWQLIASVGERIPVIDVASDGLPTLNELAVEVLGRPLS
jgi:hypothetical protein